MFTFGLEAKIGKVAMEWNAAHIVVFGLFVGFTGLPKEMAAEIFYALKADSAQRDITKAAALSALRSNNGSDELIEKVTKVFNDIGRLAGDRNKTVHAGFSVDADGYGRFDPYHPKTEYRQKLLSRLQNDEEILLRITDDIVDLFNEAAEFLEWPEELLS